MDWNKEGAFPSGANAAFPRPYVKDDATREGTIEQPGMTLREYAAIHLMVPDSGNASLDEMIKKAIASKTSKAAFKVTGA